jgi:hypothetical protein
LPLWIRYLRRPVLQGATLILNLSALPAGSGSTLQAQEVQFRTFTRLYRPTRVSAPGGVLQIRQRVGVTFGAQAVVAFNERFNLTTAVAYMPGYFSFHRVGQEFNVGSASHSLSISSGARYWLRPPGSKIVSWEVHTSVGMGTGGQSAYKDLFDNSLLSAVIGTAVRYQLGQIVSLTLKVQERLCRIRLGTHASYSTRPPLDISFGVGLPFLELNP